MFICSLIVIKCTQWLDCGREKGAGRAQYSTLSAVSPMPLAWQAAVVRANRGDSPGGPGLAPAPATATAESGLTAEHRAQPGPGKGSLLPAASPLLPAAVTVQGYAAGSVLVPGVLPEGLPSPAAGSNGQPQRVARGEQGAPQLPCYTSTSHVSTPHQHRPHPTYASSAGR